MMFEELADGVRTIHFKAIGRAAELLQQAKIMECSADKQKLYIEFFPGLPAKLICPEEDAVRVVEQQSRAELSEKSRRFASQLTIRDSTFYALKLRRRCRHRDNCFGPSKRRPCLHRHLLSPKRNSRETAGMELKLSLRVSLMLVLAGQSLVSYHVNR
jgi:hypothetical protein